MSITNVLDGIRNYVDKDAKVDYLKGCEMIDVIWPKSIVIPTPLTTEEQKSINEAVEKVNLQFINL